MVEQGDRLIFPDVGTFEDPNTGNDVVGEFVATDTVTDVERGGGDSLFGPDEGQTRISLENRGSTMLSDIGQRGGGETVGPRDVVVEPRERTNSDTISPAQIHSERSQTARVADESKDARLTTDKQQWASDPSGFDYPGVDTGPQFESTFDGDFFDF
jgi:hypothetical protein